MTDAKNMVNAKNMADAKVITDTKITTEAKNISDLVISRGGNVLEIIALQNDLYRLYGKAALSKTYTTEEFNSLLAGLREEVKSEKPEPKQEETEYLDYLVLASKTHVFILKDNDSKKKFVCVYAAGRIDLSEKDYFTEKALLEFVDEQLGMVVGSAFKKRKQKVGGDIPGGKTGPGTKAGPDSPSGGKKEPFETLYLPSIERYLQKYGSMLTDACFDEIDEGKELTSTICASPHMLRRLAERDENLRMMLDSLESLKTIEVSMFKSPMDFMVYLAKKRKAKRRREMDEYSLDFARNFDFLKFHLRDDAPAVIAWIENYRQEKGELHDSVFYIEKLGKYALDREGELIQKLREAGVDTLSERPLNAVYEWLGAARKREIALRHPWIHEHIIPALVNRDQNFIRESFIKESGTGISELLAERPIEEQALVAITKAAVEEKLFTAQSAGYMLRGLWASQLLCTGRDKKLIDRADMGLNYVNTAAQVIRNYSVIESVVGSVMKRKKLGKINLETYYDLRNLRKTIVENISTEEEQTCLFYAEDFEKKPSERKILSKSSQASIIDLYLSINPDKYNTGKKFKQ